MFNAIRMDVYRLFKTKSTYIILVIMIALTVMGTGLTSLIYDMSEPKSAQVHTEQVTEIVDQADDGSKMDDEAAMNADIDESETGVSMDVSDSVIDSDDEEVSVLSVTMSDIAGLQTGLFIIIFTVLFSMADINSGFIKSIGGQVKGRGVLILSKMIAIAIYTAIVIIVDFLTQLIAVNIFFDDAVLGSISEIFKLLSSQFVLNFALAAFVMALAIIIKNNVISMIIGVCLCTGVFELIFMGINYLMDKIGLHDFDINNLLITGKIQTVAVGADASDIGYALLTAVIYIVISVVAVYNVFKHRDI